MLWAAGCLILLSIYESQALKCYQCQSTTGSCSSTTDQCVGAWCVAIMTDDKATGQRKMEKMCAQANPAASGVDGCAKETQGSTTITKCGCQIEEFCNGDAGMARLMGERQNVPTGGGAPNPNPGSSGDGSNQPTGGILLGANQPQPQPGVPSSPQNVPSGGGSNPNNQFPPTNIQPQPPINPSLVNSLQPVNVLPPQGINLPNPPPLGGPPTGITIGNNDSSSVSQPRFPPLPGTPETGSGANFGSPLSPQNPPQLGGGNINAQPPVLRPNFGGFVVPSSSAAPEPEPALKNASLVPQGGSAPEPAGGKKPTSAASGLPKYMCRCEGPMDCKNGKCSDDFCSIIDIDMRDLSHQGGRSAGSPNNPNQPAGPQSQQQPSSPQMVKHFGCMSLAGLNGAQMVPNRIYPRLPYKFVVDGKPVTVNSNQQFCTGDFCNFAKTFSVSMALVTVCLAFLFLKL